MSLMNMTASEAVAAGRAAAESYSKPKRIEDVARWNILMTSGEHIFVTGVLLVSDAHVSIYKPGSTGADGKLFWSTPDKIDRITRLAAATKDGASQ